MANKTATQTQQQPKVATDLWVKISLPWERRGASDGGDPKEKLAMPKLTRLVKGCRP
jgi:hypothetical protein